MTDAQLVSECLEAALANAPRSDGHAALDALPLPVYVTDAEGYVTYWNRACAEFAGREPQLGKDRWCVSWRLFTTEGDPIPHERCPMAEAVRRRSPIRDAIAIALRPDGSRVAFRPYPTPMFDEAGELTGAVNLLVDVSDAQSGVLADQAARCRRLSHAMCDPGTVDMLRAMAREYEQTAASLNNGNAPR